MDLVSGLMDTHHQVQHWVGKGDLGGTPPPHTHRELYIPDIFPSGGDRSGVPRSGLPGPGLNSDRPPGPLLASPRAGHDSGPGGGESPPPVMPPVRHIRPLGGPERPTPIHGNVRQGSRNEVHVVGGRVCP